MDKGASERARGIYNYITFLPNGLLHCKSDSRSQDYRGLLAFLDLFPLHNCPCSQSAALDRPLNISQSSQTVIEYVPTFTSLPYLNNGDWKEICIKKKSKAKSLKPHMHAQHIMYSRYILDRDCCIIP